MYKFFVCGFFNYLILFTKVPSIEVSLIMHQRAHFTISSYSNELKINEWSDVNPLIDFPFSEIDILIIAFACEGWATEHNYKSTAYSHEEPHPSENYISLKAFAQLHSIDQSSSCSPDSTRSFLLSDTPVVASAALSSSSMILSMSSRRHMSLSHSSDLLPWPVSFRDSSFLRFSYSYL